MSYWEGVNKVPRELEGFRPAIEYIKEKAPDIEMFGVKDVSRLLSKSEHFVKDNIMPDTRVMFLPELARRLCKISRGEKIK